MTLCAHGRCPASCWPNVEFGHNTCSAGFDNLFADIKLFKAIVGNSAPLLYQLLPAHRPTQYSLRKRGHPFLLPTLGVNILRFRDPKHSCLASSAPFTNIQTYLLTYLLTQYNILQNNIHKPVTFPVCLIPPSAVCHKANVGTCFHMCSHILNCAAMYCLRLFALCTILCVIFRSSTYCTDVRLSCHNKHILLGRLPKVDLIILEGEKCPSTKVSSISMKFGI